MNRRIYRVILVITALTLIGFGVPLAVVVRQLNHDEMIVKLENEATRAALAVPAATKLDRGVDVDFSRVHNADALGIYDETGRLRFGVGPTRADRVVLSALKGQPARGTHDRDLVVAIPVISNQQVHAVVRAATPTSKLDDRVRSSWLLMVALAAAILVTAAIVASLESRRLSKPVDQLAVAMGRLGSGDFSVRTSRSGVAEIDEAARALDATAERLGELVERERSFSANASHQLRTPLTGIRIQLENALRSEPKDSYEQITDALGAVDRLETTIGDLLKLTRQQSLTRDSVDLAELITRQHASWQVLATSLGRSLELDLEANLPTVQVSEAAVRQILEVLVSNAFVHGSGVVVVSTAKRIGGVAIDVSDEGPGLTDAAASVFHNNVDVAFPGTMRAVSDAGVHGIGLSLARNLADSAGGRLILRNAGPNPRFSLLLVAPDDE